MDRSIFIYSVFCLVTIHFDLYVVVWSQDLPQLPSNFDSNESEDVFEKDPLPTLSTEERPNSSNNLLTNIDLPELQSTLNIDKSDVSVKIVNESISTIKNNKDGDLLQLPPLVDFASSNDVDNSNTNNDHFNNKSVAHIVDEEADLSVVKSEPQTSFPEISISNKPENETTKTSSIEGRQNDIDRSSSQLQKTVLENIISQQQPQKSQLPDKHAQSLPLDQLNRSQQQIPEWIQKLLQPEQVSQNQQTGGLKSANVYDEEDQSNDYYDDLDMKNEEPSKEEVHSLPADSEFKTNAEIDDSKDNVEEIMEYIDDNEEFQNDDDDSINSCEDNQKCYTSEKENESDNSNTRDTGDKDDVDEAEEDYYNSPYVKMDLYDNEKISEKKESSLSDEENEQTSFDNDDDYLERTVQSNAFDHQTVLDDNDTYEEEDSAITVNDNEKAQKISKDSEEIDNLDEGTSEKKETSLPDKIENEQTGIDNDTYEKEDSAGNESDNEDAQEISEDSEEIDILDEDTSEKKETSFPGKIENEQTGIDNDTYEKEDSAGNESDNEDAQEISEDSEEIDILDEDTSEKKETSFPGKIENEQTGLDNDTYDKEDSASSESDAKDSQEITEDSEEIGNLYEYTSEKNETSLPDRIENEQTGFDNDTYEKEDSAGNESDNEDTDSSVGNDEPAVNLFPTSEPDTKGPEDMIWKSVIKNFDGEDIEKTGKLDKEDIDNEEENEDDQEDSEVEKEGDKDDISAKHDNDDDDNEKRPVSEWKENDYNDDDDTDDTENTNRIDKEDSDNEESDNEDDGGANDHFESKSHIVNEMFDDAKKRKQPAAPTSMVLFYTWMIVVVLIVIVGVSTFQSRCKGFRFPGTKAASNSQDDTKRLIEHEFV